MADEAPRERLLQAIAGLLATLSGTRFWGGAYPMTPVIERLALGPAQITTYPHLLLLQDTGSRAEPLTHDVGLITPAADRDTFRFFVRGYVRGDDVETPSLWVERLNHDIKLALHAGMGAFGSLRELADRIVFEEEAVEFEGRTLAAFELPCVAWMREHLS